MPNTHETLTSLFDDIADAIREKDGTSEDIVADTFPERISAIEGGGAASNTNLLINGWFQVNQRQGKVSVQGTTIYTDTSCTTVMGTQTEAVCRLEYYNSTCYTRYVESLASGYVKISDAVDGYVTARGITIDRWIANNATIAVTSDGLSLPSPSVDVYQIIDGNLYNLYGKQVTVSAIFDDTLLSGTITVAQSTPASHQLRTVFNTDKGIAVVWGDLSTGNFQVSVVGSEVTATSKLTAIKLELGSKSTLEYDAKPYYDDDLWKCQRYYQLYRNTTFRPSYADDCRPPMYANPSQGSISINGTTYYYNSAEL